MTTFYLKYINTIKEESCVFAAGPMPGAEAINRMAVTDQRTLKGNLSPSSHFFPTSLQQHLQLKTFQRDSLEISLAPEENEFSRKPEQHNSCTLVKK